MVEGDSNLPEHLAEGRDAADWVKTREDIIGIKNKQKSERVRSCESTGKSHEIGEKRAGRPLNRQFKKNPGCKVLVFHSTPEKKRKTSAQSSSKQNVSNRVFSADDIDLTQSHVKPRTPI